MLTKKGPKSIYCSIFIEVISSLGISILIFFMLSKCVEFHIDKKETRFLSEQQENIEKFIEKIQEKIKRENLTFNMARKIDFDKGTGYDIELFIYSDINFDELNLATKGIRYIYKMEYEDRVGLATVTSYKIKLSARVYYAVVEIASVAIFLIIVLSSIFKELAYIKVIEKGINKIAEGDLKYKIDIVGNNELARLATSINVMGETIDNKIQKERLDEINQRMLITNISHDLRTPLTSMIGYVDIIEDRIDDENDIYKYTQIIKKNGLRLQKLINNLFLYSKLLSGDIPVKIEKVDINILLKQIFEIRKEEIIYKESKKVIWVNVDIEKFHRIIDNLIQNAGRYGVENEPIIVSTRVEKEKIIIAIQNKTEDDLRYKMNSIKNRLYTGNEDRANGASGLGLAIVTELLKTIDGNMELYFKNYIFTVIIEIPNQ